ncbi:MAG: GrpB family protein [Gemmatimonadaceae bacterium]
MSTVLQLLPYDSRWPAKFAAESTRIAQALGTDVLAIEHVGSTAVPGLPGKPVLDMALAVENIARADACITRLQLLDYEYRGLNGDDPQRRYYVRAIAGQRIAQLHLYIMPALAWDELLAFRDALRRDPDLAAASATEKRRAADAVQWDKSAYSIEKGHFVQAALQELRRTGWLRLA